jgi:hypothetical protein
MPIRDWLSYCLGCRLRRRDSPSHFRGWRVIRRGSRLRLRDWLRMNLGSLSHRCGSQKLRVDLIRGWPWYCCDSRTRNHD